MTPKIILIGPPGSGKSTIGKKLSEILSIDFSDTDALIEAKTSKSISDIFIELGEPEFRLIEAEVLRTALVECTGVLALGGGAPISQAAQDAIVDTGVAVAFLDISLSTAAPRIGFNRDRPLLLGNPRAQWSELFATRRPIYEKISSLHIDANVGSPAEIAEKIAKEIR